LKIICKIYRSERQQGAYLFTCLDQGLDAVPVSLKTKLQPLVEAMTLVLQPGRSLANADIDKVLSSLDETGFYLQMPPAHSESNSKQASRKDSSPLAASHDY